MESRKRTRDGETKVTAEQKMLDQLIAEKAELLIAKRKAEEASGSRGRLDRVNFVQQAVEEESAKRSKRRDHQRRKRKPTKKSRRRSPSVTSGSDSDVCGSSESSVFREALDKGKLTHLNLQRLAKDRPGRLTAKKLQEMAQVVDDQAMEREFRSHETSASARAYYLRVIKPEFPNAPVRGLREVKTLCYALDQMALGRYPPSVGKNTGLDLWRFWWCFGFFLVCCPFRPLLGPGSSVGYPSALLRSLG